MTVGEVAAQARVNVQTVRYYERRGLLAPPPRTMAGYRLYSDGVVDRIRFIKRAQELGFTLEEIADLLTLRVRRGQACEEVLRRATARLELVEEKMRALENLCQSLKSLIASCRDRTPTAECPILAALEEEEHA